MAKTQTIHDFELATIDGASKKLSDFRGQVLLVVNVASKCGLTPHYRGLQSLYEEKKGSGFAVLGFPCNQFGGQEPGSEADVKQFCTTNYGVTFPMFSKVEVNGSNAHPVFAFLRRAKAGLMGDRIKWNFTKFLVDREGNVVKRYASTTKPEKIEADIEKLLAS